MPGSWRSDRSATLIQPTPADQDDNLHAKGDSSPTLPCLTPHQPESNTQVDGNLTPSPHSSLSSASVILQTPFESTTARSESSPSASRPLEDEHETSACLDPAPPLPALSPVQHAGGRSLQRPLAASPLNGFERSATGGPAQRHSSDAQGPWSPPPSTPLPPCPSSFLPSLKSPVADSAPHVPPPPLGRPTRAIRRDLSLPISLHDVESGKRTVHDLYRESGSRDAPQAFAFLSAWSELVHLALIIVLCGRDCLLTGRRPANLRTGSVRSRAVRAVSPPNPPNSILNHPSSCTLPAYLS